MNAPPISFSSSSLAGVKATIQGNNDVTIEDGKVVVTGGSATVSANGSWGKRPPPVQIFWQDTLVDREAGQEPNGAFVEDILFICQKRLEAYQVSAFACKENAEALDHLKEAIAALERRRADRRTRSVEGKNEQ